MYVLPNPLTPLPSTSLRTSRERVTNFKVGFGLGTTLRLRDREPLLKRTSTSLSRALIEIY